MITDELGELIRGVYRDALDAMETHDRNALLEGLAMEQQDRRPDRAERLRSLMILPNGHIIRRGAPLPMPVVPRDRVEPRSARRPKPLAVKLYESAIGPQPRVTLPYAVEALLKIETPAPQAIVVDDPPPLGKIVNVRNIIAVVRSVCDVEHADIVGPWRHKQATRARHIVMWLARRHTMTSLPQIGRWIGRRDHSTVLNGIRKIDALLKLDTAEAETVRAIIVECRIALGLPIYDPE